MKKVALVTGGAAGIGRACCDALAGHGVHVVVGDVNREVGQGAVEELNAGNEADSISTSQFERAA